MARNEKMKLDEEEKNILYNLMHNKKVKQKEIAKKINISPSYLNAVLKGKKFLDSKKAQQIYEILGKDSSVRFLVNTEYSEKSVANFLDTLYSKYYSALNSVYEKSSEKVKFGIVSKLEKMVKKSVGNNP
jgi:transcriptional regulator with XRE-family HTH domain